MPFFSLGYISWNLSQAFYQEQCDVSSRNKFLEDLVTIKPIEDTEVISRDHQPRGKTLNLVMRVPPIADNPDWDEQAIFVDGLLSEDTETMMDGEDNPLTEKDLRLPPALRAAFADLSTRTLHSWFVLYRATGNGEVMLQIKGFPPAMIESEHQVLQLIINWLDESIERYKRLAA